MNRPEDFAKRNFVAPVFGPHKPRKTFVLLFDGTGNKFSGTESDSNILKILRMLDRSDSSQLHYYQVRIGTYVHSSTYSHTSVFTRVNSWLQKTRDSAVGTSFDVHVMGGYKFLMKYYKSGDDIYFFGFSRGAYIARFLAEMLDYVGLLEPGNEEMARFAWKAFAQWQMRLDGTEEEIAKKDKMFKYLQAFRDTFSRPVRRIRFIGLFDTVNSVPRFENAWMQRSKFPYTAKSSALVIRHAVGIDERRAKFRQDLISETSNPAMNSGPGDDGTVPRGRPIQQKVESTLHVPHKSATPHKNKTKPNERYRRRKSRARLGRVRSISPGGGDGENKDAEGHSLRSSSSMQSMSGRGRPEEVDSDDDDEADEALPQNIQEMWFPGGHADIGGGWPLHPSEELPLSHGPLVWIVREARRAGLRFDVEKMLEMRCLDPDSFDEDPADNFETASTAAPDVPTFRISGADSPDSKGDGELTNGSKNGQNGEMMGKSAEEKSRKEKKSTFYRTLESAAARSVLHDCLEFGQGLSRVSVASWNFMEYLPFKRMDLMPDNSWSSIRWPLPKGEVRDMPSNALIHTSALRRMESDPKYRPGNLIIGGGGRGVKRAPEKYGIGEWEMVRDEGDPVGECVRRKVRGKEVESEK